MDDPWMIQELEEWLNRDRKLLADLKRREIELLQHIPKKGFGAEAERKHLLDEMKELHNSIDKNARMVVMAKK